MKKYKIITLGCKVNRFESDAISASLDALDFKQSQKTEDLEIYIINTCAITGKASMQSRQEIRKALRLKEKNKNLKVIATGCFVQTEPYEIRNIEGIDIIVGNADKHNIPYLIADNKEILIKNIFEEKEFAHIPITLKKTRQRQVLKIQDGCSCFCSYCIVPYARGASRSMKFDDVIEYIKKLDSLSFKEAVLTGINLGCYGEDLSPKTDLFSLLKYIDEKKLIHRVRLSSIEPDKLSSEIIKLVSESNTFCDHFHIPLQSGDDEILKKMKRPYTKNFFENLIMKIAQLMPNAAVGIDIMAGFPEESEKAFENTYSLIEKLPISYLHVFPFSPRKNTLAEKFKNKVASIEIKKRAKKLRMLGEEKKERFYESQKGRIIEAIIESEFKKGMLKARTSNYLTALIKGDTDLVGKIVKVKMTPQINKLSYYSL